MNDIIIAELRRIVDSSGILDLEAETIKKWPEPNGVGKQELVVDLIEDKRRHRINVSTCKFGSFVDIKKSNDPNGLSVFHYLLQDVKCMVFSLINMHFRLKPV